MRELVSQDQMRIVKTRLLEMLPHARIFLGLLPSDRRPSARAFCRSRLRFDVRFATRVPDVDDLTEGKGAEFVDASAATLVFVSAG